MVAIFIGIIVGILILLLIWYLVSRPQPIVVNGNPVVPPNLAKIPPTQGNTQSNATQALTDFSVALFDTMQGKVIVINPMSSRLAETLCNKSKKTEAQNVLNEYVSKIMTAANISSGDDCSSSGGEHTPTDTEHLDEIRRLANTLNSIFNGCVNGNGKSFGLIFGVLANSVLAYKLALDKGQTSKAEEIRTRMLNHLQKMTL